ncbi:Dual specificity phosphatase DUPD1 [Anabarilius grahami]|uniref:Dual specificity phosphatase DUPD1 n=1 Tax=Anabarilius grahami TaxID=495550 RepID=A0A3N0Z0N4_ANAGA|nr:Dual specificity phosphatase DUPD1 [Anabarilius grahami]
MSTNFREVCMEIYLSGEFYCGDSCWVPDEEGVELEFQITDAIYDLIGTDQSAQIHLELQAETGDDISVSYCALEGNVVKLVADEIKTTSVCECQKREKQLETDPAGPSAEASENCPTGCTNGWMNTIGTFFKRLFCKDLTVPEASTPEPEPEMDLVDPEDLAESAGPSTEVSGSSSGMDASPETQENSPKESTNGWMMNKIGAFFKMLFWRDPAVPEPVRVPDASAPEQTSEMDLVPGVPEMEPEFDQADPEQLCVPVPSVPEPESELDLLFNPDEPCQLVTSIPDLDLFDSDESCVPGPSSAVPKPNASTSKQDPFPEEECFQLCRRVKACTMRYKPVTQVWNNIFIGNEETARDRMRMKELGITHILNATAMKKKLRIFLGIIWEKDVKDTVDTGASYYRGMKIRYRGLPTTKTSNISKYFLPAAKFIQKARKNSENKVFIHCTDGVNYAPTLFLAYLMIHHNMTVEDAIDYLVKVKYVKPDIDSLRQLAILNEELVHK